MPMCRICGEDVKLAADQVNLAWHSHDGHECAGSGTVALQQSNINYARMLQAMYKERTRRVKVKVEATEAVEQIEKQIGSTLEDAKRHGWPAEVLAEMDLAS